MNEKSLAGQGRMAQNSKKKATIYDLSVLSGVSASTISAVLNGTWRKRRIKEDTAKLVLDLAREHQYTTNMQARGLRSARSGLSGLLLPIHDSRYFSSMAQTFEAHARARGQCPVVVSACRDPEEERRTVETLISYSIDELVIAGATDPDSIHDLCEAAGLRHVNIDLPGTRAPSVVSDNYRGAVQLTEAIIARFRERDPLRPEELFLFGGRDDYASRERIRGFQETQRRLLGAAPAENIQKTGYSPETARKAFEGFYTRTGKSPRALFINSTINFEGFLRFMGGHPNEAFGIVVGCYDYDPFASFLPFPVIMIRQDAESMIAKAFEILDDKKPAADIHLIKPELVLPRSALTGPLDSIKDTE